MTTSILDGAPINPRPIFDLVGVWLPGGWNKHKDKIPLLDRAISLSMGVGNAPFASDVPAVRPKVGLTRADFEAAAEMIPTEAYKIRAFWEVEATGSGWFTDIRADILNLDGPGGFIDGDVLLKILFEAKWFSHYTKGKYDKTHPNISSRTWNRALYVGGQGEWARLWKAMQLDRTAALMSASVGGPQIMGFNHRKAGYDTVEKFWNGMAESEYNHLVAFVNFCRNTTGLVAALKRLSPRASDCEMAAGIYNGAGFKKNDYHTKIARAVAKWKAAWG